MKNTLASPIIQRIRAEYLEMPGLSLKPEQVQRLCGVDSTLCLSVLEALVESGFLSMRSDGAYGRGRNPDASRARQLKATLKSGVIAFVGRVRPRAS